MKEGGRRGEGGVEEKMKEGGRRGEGGVEERRSEERRVEKECRSRWAPDP